MSLSIYYLMFATILLIATISTILVGVSKKNKEGNPSYDGSTKSYWVRFSWIYIVVIVLSYVAFFVYIVKSPA
jgi:heme/copper-type cytochrome/quinol oxidase subunit 2